MLKKDNYKGDTYFLISPVDLDGWGFARSSSNALRFLLVHLVFRNQRVEFETYILIGVFGIVGRDRHLLLLLEHRYDSFGVKGGR